ncbi:MAG: cob(I)yrinic acid a,c-diamide adenosyltransferase [Deltaproteobacteria bacterium]|nr:MAG: cob(I)yrinic acid a,c-diamide adenosyltransferase [Deltaproteobacteria bacterium]
MTRGYVHVYTGKGKGKSTAAFGLALRALGAGKTVRVIQFMKKGKFSELTGFRAFNDRIQFDQFGTGSFVRSAPAEIDRIRAAQGLELAKTLMADNGPDLLILDEANVAAGVGLLKEADLVRLIQEKPAAMELVLTGRHAPQSVLEAADLVTEMACVKHYYAQGVPARVGIEM